LPDIRRVRRRPTAGTLGFGIDTGNPYAGGNVIHYNGGGSFPAAGDLTFTVQIAPESPTPTKAVAWGTVKGIYR
jgi:hypothetical protein